MRRAINITALLLALILPACNATKDKLVWVKGSKTGEGARVEVDGGGFTSGASARIEQVDEYASIPKDWTGPVPWESRGEDAPAPPE